jgi:2-dehydro-3-deoxy-D-pentonate aldolase
MNRSSPHRGVIVPMSTPFLANGDLDELAAERLADRLASHELGIFVLGTTGEASSVPTSQRERLVSTALRAAQARVPVYAGIGDNTVADSIEAGRRYRELGVAAVVAHVPCYYPLTPEEMQACFELLHRELGGPLMLYNIPQTTHMSLPLDLVERLSELPQVVGFKDSENTTRRLEETARRFAGKPDFAILMGVASMSVHALKAGFDGLVPSSGNLVPDLWQQLWQHACAGRWAEAEKLQQRLDAIGQVLQRNRSLGGYLAALKAALAAQRICTPEVLPPLRSLPASERRAVEAELAELQVL